MSVYCHGMLATDFVISLRLGDVMLVSLQEESGDIQQDQVHPPACPQKENESSRPMFKKNENELLMPMLRQNVVRAVDYAVRCSY